jgi:D-alanyl-D-alanine carboxypeptidase (penicillin-binding protein 5/6)
VLTAALAVCALLPTTAMATTTDDVSSVIGGPRMAEKGFITAPGAPAVPATSAAGWVVADADTGEVLAARNPHGGYRPASTQKTLLALTMAPRIDPGSTIVADTEDANQEGTRIGLWPGFTYRVDDLWYALLLKSGNDAATALAKAGGGTTEHGVAMMQAEARRLQANDTTVVNPSGLDADGQFSSAYDLALWGRAALSRGDLRHYISTIRHNFHAVAVPAVTPFKDETMYAKTENRLMLQEFPGAIGVKMGYTTKAQNTMIAAAQRDGRTIIATLMFTPGGRITSDAAALLNYGFAVDGTIAPVGQLVEPLSAAVISDADTAPSVGYSTNDIRTVSSDGTSKEKLSGFPVSWTTATGALMSAAVLGLLAMWPVKRRRRLVRSAQQQL